MKWMEGWNWQDYCSAPQELIDEIITLLKKEQEEYERRELERG